MRIFIVIRSLYWRILFRLHGVRIGKGLRVEGPLDILLRDGAAWENIEIGNNVTLGGKTYFRLRKNGKIKLGNGIKTGTEVWFVAANDNQLFVGDQTIISSYSIFNAGHGIKIGENCLFAAFAYLLSSNHKFDKDKLIQKQGYTGAPIEIGNDVWVGGHVLVLPGIKIGGGSVIGAGAVVTHDIADNEVVAGNPAKVLRKRQ